ncbi:hypothetical protein NON00_01350 [Roseomonas sp. GC11]|uniref:hypothetical protein n=1 Tax=Roseomonas sp. GC11 TaxID=2950546 RepID=UPI00210D35F8|nr:hypothetical protein [Roseomonas sp. GC11]MCQ4158574.1 hypothetical protein [Roseomonas sp. GC11]
MTTDYVPPRRIVPQAGPHLWTGEALSPADWMLPLGAGTAAEIESALATPGAPLARLSPLLGQVVERLGHGQGFALLRGLPCPAEPMALLGLLGSRLGRPAAVPAATGPWHTEPCDILLLLCREPTEIALLSAAALHNILLGSDRAALEVLYRPLPSGGDLALPVFAVSGGTFSARCDRAALDPAALGGALASLELVAAEPGLPLKLPLRPGDVLAVNPFLVWASRAPGLSALPLRATPSRLEGGPFAVLAAES